MSNRETFIDKLRQLSKEEMLERYIALLNTEKLTDYVSDLEAKLAESEKDRLMWQEMYKSADKQNKEICETDIYPLQEENEKYKKLINDICNKYRVASLKELDEILQATNESLDASRKYLDEETSKGWTLEKQVDQLKQQLAEKDKLLREKIGNLKTNDFIGLCLDCGFMIDAKDKDNQDKISFAVEQLERLKHDIWTDQQDDGWLDEKVDIYFLTETIDNQIKKLTHQHEDKGENK